MEVSRRSARADRRFPVRNVVRCNLEQTKTEVQKEGVMITIDDWSNNATTKEESHHFSVLSLATGLRTGRVCGYYCVMFVYS